MMIRSLAILSLLFFVACQEQKSGSARKSKSAIISNSSSTVNAGNGRILEDNPIILSNNPNLSANINPGSYLKSQQEFITTNSFLYAPCKGASGVGDVSRCFEARKNEDALTALGGVEGNKWAFDPTSSEFTQVNAFGHVKRIIGVYESAILQAHSNSLSGSYTSSIPLTLYSQKGNWYRLFGNNESSSLMINADVNFDDNAFFDPAKFSLNFGSLSKYPTVKMAHDSTVIYHESGHALIHTMLNFRNSVGASIPYRAEFGYAGYDEEGMLGEGLADVFSYLMNQRTHVGEWALGRFLKQSRPLRESDPIHAGGITGDVNARLSYPTYLNYDPNDPTKAFEDIHYAGQIVSHFMIAYMESIKGTCGFSHDTMRRYYLNILAETLAELGDLSGRGFDTAIESTVNLSTLTSEHALEWQRISNPINSRKFFQTFSKHTLNVLSNNVTRRCNGTVFPRATLETLLDQYGLLLFNNYNEDGNGAITGHAGIHTAVTPTNRLKTVLIPKDLVKLDPRQNVSTAYFIDNQASIKSSMAALIGSRQADISSEIPSDFIYNNGNNRPSPGEVVGLALSLYNDSNSPMAGIQVLANNWDHYKTVSGVQKMCGNFPDLFPLLSEGAANTTAEDVNAYTPVAGDCRYPTRNNGDDALVTDPVMPVCSLQLIDTDATKWVSQTEFLNKTHAVDEAHCLGGAGATKDCFVRVIKGLDTAWFSKINAKKTWAETMNEGNNSSPTFSSHHLIYMELNPGIPPGTKVNCRFRVRFSNCSDCFNDSTNSGDDFQDFEFAGPKPFKIINYQFTVID
jgi:hypothetical protein